MSDEARKEMVSAYVDGELSADERARVETWLAESPELRQLRDELMALSTSVRALPSHKLEHDLAPRVLRRATQAAGDDVAGKAAERSRAPRVEPVELIQAWRSRGGWRRWAWPAVALAAALAILVFDSQQPAVERQVARAPAEGSAEQASGKAKVAPDNAPLPAANVATDGYSETHLPSDLGIQAAKPQGKAEQFFLQPSGASAAKQAPTVGEGMMHSLRRMAEPSTRATTLGAVRARADFVCDVSEAFIRENAFEKLLDKQKIAWKRAKPDNAPGDSADARRGSAAKDADEALIRPDGRRDYTIEATRDQIDAIVAELLKDSASVKRIAPNEQLVEKSKAAREAPVVPHSVTFTLQSMPPPAEGEKSP
jgi:anti-sigma factor RsiW